MRALKPRKSLGYVIGGLNVSRRELFPIIAPMSILDPMPLKSRKRDASRASAAANCPPPTPCKTMTMETVFLYGNFSRYASEKSPR